MNRFGSVRSGASAPAGKCPRLFPKLDVSAVRQSLQLVNRARAPKFPGCPFQVCASASSEVLSWPTSRSSSEIVTSSPPALGLPREDRGRISSTVLLVADLLHPLDALTVEKFLNGDMRHAGRCRRSMPMLLTRRDPHNVAFLASPGLDDPMAEPNRTRPSRSASDPEGGCAKPSARRARTSRGLQTRVTEGAG
jgi:hypothetical protein